MTCTACGNAEMSQMMGYEDPKVYDGVLTWQCLKCGFAWPRWEPDFGDRYTHGAAWADRLNASLGVIDGRDPAGIEHLCIKDLCIHDGPVEECCENEWREERAALG